jgi:hypothetical protein
VRTAGFHKLDDIGQHCPAGGDFQRGTLVQKTMLHIDNDQSRLALVDPVGLVNPVAFLLDTTVDVNHLTMPC